MTPVIGFLVFLCATVVLLLAVVLTGRAAARRAHLVLVALTLASLGTTVYWAERLGEGYDLEAAGAITPVHLFLAKVTVFAYLGPLISGVRTLKRPDVRPLHRKLAYLALALTVVTFVTGSWMVLAATPLG
jgi:hypothetical protein